MTSSMVSVKNAKSGGASALPTICFTGCYGRALDVVKSLPERNRFVRGLRTWVGFRQVGIPYERHERYAGKPKYTFLRLLRLAYDGLFSFSSVPLHLITLLGVIVSAASFFAILVVLYFRLFTNLSIPGFA